MKSKHCFYGEKTDSFSFYNYHNPDNLFRESTIAAPLAQERLL